MKIVVIGLNHKSAPIQIRERLSFNKTQATELLNQLREQYPESEFALLSTCNRVELYTVSDLDGWTQDNELIDFLARVKSFTIEEFKEHLYIHVGEDAVKHLLTVTSGLDSLVLGESQIVGQVKDCYKMACENHTAGKVLNRLFHSAFSSSKEVHTSTAISAGRVSVAGVAIELAMQLFSDIKQARALVVGAGQMGELLVKHLRHVGCEHVTIVNRSLCKAQSMAAKHGVQALPWDALEGQFMESDIVVGSASVEQVLFDKQSFKQIAKARRNKTLLIIDIAVPRNFDPAIGELQNMYLFSVDDLSSVAQQNIDAREHDIATGLAVVQENMREFMEWFAVRDLGPQIGQLKAALSQISEKELDRFFVGARENASCRNVLNPMVNRVVNKILFCFIKYINATAKERGIAEAKEIVDQIVTQAGHITADDRS
ncbi:MAG: glutamyl-tRNA reductase [Phycisphaeraceae bacterium]|nr:glutamyl-tRNA reductase [Phycisphaeraceae bacterium]